MENNCAVNFAKFILNSNYFQYFTNSSNVGTYWPKCHFDYNEGIFHILQSKTHSNTAPFIICCNSNAIDFSLTHFDFSFSLSLYVTTYHDPFSIKIYKLY